MYYTKTTQATGTILFKVEGDITTIFPPNLENTDYQAYLKWVSKGNTPLPADE
jgi:hypothetical protein